jgi:hypothetical protein
LRGFHPIWKRTANIHATLLNTAEARAELKNMPNQVTNTQAENPVPQYQPQPLSISEDTQMQTLPAPLSLYPIFGEPSSSTQPQVRPSTSGASRSKVKQSKKQNGGKQTPSTTTVESGTVQNVVEQLMGLTHARVQSSEAGAKTHAKIVAQWIVQGEIQRTSKIQSVVMEQGMFANVQPKLSCICLVFLLIINSLHI